MSTLSCRSLIEVFTTEVGMTPKRIESGAAIHSEPVALARSADRRDWARLARACGYFDQSHLIHDVGEFTGTSPRQLVQASEQVKRATPGRAGRRFKFVLQDAGPGSGRIGRWV